MTNFFTKDDVRQGMHNRNQDPLTSAMNAMKAELEKLRADELCGVSQTTNHCHADNLTAAR